MAVSPIHPVVHQKCSVDDPDISICGNDVCERGEYEYNCPEDCTGTDPVRECGDKVCDPEIWEDYIKTYMLQK